MISRDDILDTAQAFPSTYQSIRKAAIRMAVRRQFILAAKLMSNNFGRVERTFDRMLEQATTVPLAELRLQRALTAHRLEVGPNASFVRSSSSSHGAPTPQLSPDPQPPTSVLGQSSVLPFAHTPAALAVPGEGEEASVSGQLSAVTSMIKKESSTSFSTEKGKGGGVSWTAAQGREEVLGAIADVRREVVAELGGRIDQLGEGLGALRTMVADLAARLPPPVADEKT